MSTKSARVFVGGDVCPTPADIELFQAGDAVALFGDILALIEASHLSIVNLECPLIDSPSPISKSGAHFGVPPPCINGLVEAGIDVISLANNHILDHGQRGLEVTLETCQSAGLQTVGAGKDLQTAQRMLLVERNRVRIGILSCAEHEFSIASSTRGGANPIDPIDFTRIVAGNAGRFDHLVVLLHAGKEHTPYPSPRLQKMARFMIEQGASIVTCQHSHYAGVYEHYRDGFISYGQGNFIFNPHPDARPWLYQGYGLVVDLDIDSAPEVQIVPYKQVGTEPGIRLLDPDTTAEFKKGLSEESAKIRDENFIQRQWFNLCRSNKQLYLSILRGQGRILRNVNKRIPMNDLFYSELQKLILYNAVHCESKHEELATILADMIDDTNQ